MDIANISLIQAEGDFCKIIDSLGKLHSVSKSIGLLVEELDPKYFFRINRSQIVNIDRINKMELYTKNRLALKLEGTEKTAITSSSTTRDFRKWMEG